jgi:hypothetical protein
VERLDRHRIIYRWDLDKTYLRTEFDTLRDLLSRAFEGAADKRTVPGAAALLRELRDTGPAGIFILSGSPEQMRKVLEAKLRLDGIQWDGFTLKPSLRNLLRGHFKFLRDQVGYKLGALLSLRANESVELDEILFGDDAETDAFVYSLYADLCAGKVESRVLEQVLEQAAVSPEDRPRLVQAAARLPKRDHCRRLFIHLDRISPLERFAEYGSRVCPFYNYFQAAAALLEMGALEAPGALRVAAELVIDQSFTAEALTASFLELAGRGQVSRRAAQELVEAVARGSAEFASAGPTLRDFVRELDLAALPTEPAPIPEPDIDYVALLGRERSRAHAAKLRVLGRH